MGRYYSGDIEGKFWFGVQSSYDADYFGVEGEPVYWDEDAEENEEPYSLGYGFTTENLGTINEGIDTCLEVLGEYKEKIDKFFEVRTGYNNEDLEKEFGLSKERVQELLENYARLELGMAIKKCVEDTGQCYFDAEL